MVKTSWMMVATGPDPKAGSMFHARQHPGEKQADEAGESAGGEQRNPNTEADDSQTPKNASKANGRGIIRP
jgi:hypothetical protein